MFLENALLRNFNAPPGSASYTHEHVLKVHLITSNIPVKLMSDYLPQSNDYQWVTFTELKIPDTTSLAGLISSTVITLFNGQTKNLKFLTNYQPCYK